MELFVLLEQRVEGLLVRVKELATHNNELESANQVAQSRNKELELQVSKLGDEVLELTAELESLKESVMQERSKLEEELNQKALAKLIVEDLVKNIEASTLNEQQP